MRCKASKCEKPARMAIRVTRPKREDLRITIYADERVAPKAATPYCKEHGTSAVQELTNVVVDGDED